MDCNPESRGTVTIRSKASKLFNDPSAHAILRNNFATLIQKSPFSHTELAGKSGCSEEAVAKAGRGLSIGYADSVLLAGQFKFRLLTLLSQDFTKKLKG
jgi:hypothetical protein